MTRVLIAAMGIGSIVVGTVLHGQSGKQADDNAATREKVTAFYNRAAPKDMVVETAATSTSAITASTGIIISEQGGTLLLDAKPENRSLRRPQVSDALYAALLKRAVDAIAALIGLFLLGHKRRVGQGGGVLPHTGPLPNRPSLRVQLHAKALRVVARGEA